ncbi:vascular endothelial growth factor A-A isoform X2 [Belonocnema kinseyi]|uniref:vascular endothelial growth factor A-A isoform X2 n=1 Tax=Belonocnema kinseyi TaxID=2817044 RepID=UPI00143D6F32|nr:vascular endothelial growth factor A-A isoform X2 [Belonocnema kinseyi]
MWFLIFALVCGFSSCERHQEPEAIQWPGPISRREESSVLSNSCDLVKSLEIARRLNTLESIDDYLNILQGAPSGLSSSRSGGIVKRYAVIKATPALCMPENQTVPVVEDPDPSIIYLPKCTRVKRCGGCCLHQLLSCQPTETRSISMEIYTSSVEDTSFKFAEKKVVQIEEHVKCRCLCTIKASHCTEKQDYLEDECRCQCRNLDEKEKCQASDVRKAWNPELCACQSAGN